MRIFFRSPELVITERAIIRLMGSQTAFSITELHDIHVVRGELFSGGAGWRHPRTWELRATYRKVNVCLYRTTDRQRFGQVRRATIRALEANDQLAHTMPVTHQDDPNLL